MVSRRDNIRNGVRLIAKKNEQKINIRRIEEYEKYKIGFEKMSLTL